MSPDPETGRTAPVSLRRELGRWDLTAIGINQVIGGAIFLTPSEVAAHLGNWAPLAFVLAGVASLLVALCLAEAGSRFERTGGPYLYTRAAFGRFVAFEVGWMQWATRAISQASIVNGITLALGFYWPLVTAGAGRLAVIAAITAALAVVNVRGIRESSWVVNTLTVAKLVPLCLFIAVGLFFVDPARLAPLPGLAGEQIASGALILIFIYGGFDVIGVPAGEASDPRRHLPFAFIATIAAVTVVMTLAQVVAMGTLQDVTASSTPIADSAHVFLGAVGALMIGIGSVLSMTGNNAGQVLSGSRMLFALAENGELPPWFARVHARYRTPAHAVLFTSAVALALASTGSFARLAAISAVARLVTYVGACAATLRLRRPALDGRVKPATFTVPLGPVVPLAAIAMSFGILAGASAEQRLGGLIALVLGAAIFWLNDRTRPRRT